MKYTISEMASLLGVTTHMLRHYEKVGIIEPEVNEENGYRYYTVLDTRRFNLSRLLLSCGFSLEQCTELMGDLPMEDIDGMLSERQRKLAVEAKLVQHKIRYLQSWREMLPALEEDVGKIQIEHFPRMWRLNLSHVETAKADEELQKEKLQWLACFPAAKWVSRIPYHVLKQFGTGPIEYDFGLMIKEDDGRELGLRRSAFVEKIPEGDFLTVVHRKEDRGPFTWEDINAMTQYLAENGLTFFGDAFSTIQASVKIDGKQINYHKMMVKVFS